MLGRGSGRVVEKWEDRLNSQQKEIMGKKLCFIHKQHI